MKKLPFIYCMLAVAAAGIIIYSCGKGKPKPVDGDINPAFEMAPPVSDDLQVKLLEKPIDGANILVTAKLDARKVKGSFHAVMVGDEKIVLRDDGKQGDEKAGDGIFSVAIKEDETELQKDFTALQDAAVKGIRSQKPLFQFVNRSAVAIDEKLKNLFLETRFDLKKGIAFKPGIFFTLPPDPKLKTHSLMVTDLGVVEDKDRTFNPCAPPATAGTPMGAWTFGNLMTDMANGNIPAEDF